MWDSLGNPHTISAKPAFPSHGARVVPQIQPSVSAA